MGSTLQLVSYVSLRKEETMESGCTTRQSLHDGCKHGDLTMIHPPEYCYFIGSHIAFYCVFVMNIYPSFASIRIQCSRLGMFPQLLTFSV